MKRMLHLVAFGWLVLAPLPAPAQDNWHASKVRRVQGPAVSQPQAKENGAVLQSQSQRGSGDSLRRKESCRDLRNTYISQPFINIYSIDSVSSDYYRVRGSFEGKCLSEAGYFENDRRVSYIQVRTVPEFDRFEFDLRVRADANPQLRAYNINGERVVYPIQVYARQYPLIHHPHQPPAPPFAGPPTRGVDPNDPSLLANRKRK